MSVANSATIQVQLTKLLVKNGAMAMFSKNLLRKSESKNNFALICTLEGDQNELKNTKYL